MHTPQHPQPLNRASFCTGGWRVDPLRGTLERGGQSVRLEPKVMDVLVCLARRSGQVVTKDELIRDVWENRFVGEDVITVAIHELRKALGDAARQPTFIETIPRRGYQWLAPIEEISDATSPTKTTTPPAKNMRGIAIAAGLLLAVGVSGWVLAHYRPLRLTPFVADQLQVEAAYQKGRHFLDQRSRPALSQALKYFEEAMRLNPKFAEAHAGIAQTNAMMADAGLGDRTQLYGRAREAAQRSLDLRPDLAEGHAAMGMVRLIFDWDFARAEEHLRRAVAAKPNLREGHQLYAWLLSAVGRHEEAIAEARLALALDPVSTARYTELAWALSYSGRYRESIAEIDRALELDPHYFMGHLSKGMLLELMGDTRAAYASIRTAYAQREGGEVAARLDETFQSEGLRGIYRSWLRVMQANTSPTMPRNEVWRASLHSRVGEVDQAIEALQRAYEEREGGMAWLRVNPSFMPLRYDARFQNLVQRVGLAQ